MEEDSSFSDIKTKVPRKYRRDLVDDDRILQDAENEWLPVCNNQGFIYFYKRNTGECQYAFPKVYNPAKKAYSQIL
jgi:hypothetical protein